MATTDDRRWKNLYGVDAKAELIGGRTVRRTPTGSNLNRVASSSEESL